MKVKIHGKEIALRDEDVDIAKKVLNRFVGVVKNGAIDNNMPTLYLTVIAVMRVKSEEMLNSIDPSMMHEIISILNKCK